MKRFLLAALLATAISIGSVASPAQASDKYNTSWKVSQGVSVVYGPYSQYTFTRSATIAAYNNTKGYWGTIRAASLFCALVAFAPAVAACGVLVNYQVDDVHAQLKQAYNDGKCVALRVYNNPAMWPFARPVAEVSCNYDIQVGGGGSGGGGGGGGGGSWRTMYYETS